MTAPRPFRLAVPDAALDDLRQRLARTRWPDEPPLEPWSTGTSLAYMKDLVWTRSGSGCATAWATSESRVRGRRRSPTA